jgi:hypothetical protein
MLGYGLRAQYALTRYGVAGHIRRLGYTSLRIHIDPLTRLGGEWPVLRTAGGRERTSSSIPSSVGSDPRQTGAARCIGCHCATRGGFLRRTPRHATSQGSAAGSVDITRYRCSAASAPYRPFDGGVSAGVSAPPTLYLCHFRFEDDLKFGASVCFPRPARVSARSGSRDARCPLDRGARTGKSLSGADLMDNTTDRSAVRR